MRTRRLTPLTAQELLAALPAVPGAKSVPVTGDGLVESRLVGGIEIARAKAADERELRELWRARFSGGPTPLLLVADEPAGDGLVSVLGPLPDDSRVRLVIANELLRVLERLPRLETPHAVRELAEELERLDRTGGSRKTPGMGQPGWFPDHGAERQAEYARTTPGERVAEAIELSRLTTRLAALGHRRRAR